MTDLLTQRIEFVQSVEQELIQLGLLERTEIALIADIGRSVELIEILASKCPPSSLNQPKQMRAWELVGVIYQNQGRHSEALSVLNKLYDQMLLGQKETQNRFHKGMPLVRISDSYLNLGYPLLALRFLMLTLVEDAISGDGTIAAKDTGVYWRLVTRGWLSDRALRQYGKEVYGKYDAKSEMWRYPEYGLQQLDSDWIIWAPTPQESGIFVTNGHYLGDLIDQLGEGTGKILEQIAEYLMSCMPGCRTARRLTSGSTDYDVVCSVEGLESDFRSELGRYFVCECKDWADPANFTSFAKFCRVLDSVKARFGILFSRHGLTGAGKRQDAELEQLKVFQDRGIVIVVLTESDLKAVAQGANLITLLRRRYEQVRLNIAPVASQ